MARVYPFTRVQMHQHLMASCFTHLFLVSVEMIEYIYNIMASFTVVARGPVDRAWR